MALKINHLEEQLRETFNKWWELKVPKLVLSLVDLNDSGISLEESSSTDRCNELLKSGYKELCKTIVKILPSNALLITGQRRGLIDSLMIEEIRKASHTTGKFDVDQFCEHQLPCSSTDEQTGKIILNSFAQVPNEEVEKNESSERSRPFRSGLKRFMGFRRSRATRRINRKNNQKSKQHTTGDDIQRGILLSMYRQENQHWIEYTNLTDPSYESKPSKHVDTISVINISRYKGGSTTGSKVIIEMRGQKESLDDLLESIASGKITSNNSEGEYLCQPMTIDNEEQNRIKLMRMNILRFLLEDDTENDEAFRKFANKLYDEDMLKELLDRVSRGNMQDLTFDCFTSEVWIQQFLEEPDDGTLHDIKICENIQMFPGTNSSPASQEDQQVNEAESDKTEGTSNETENDVVHRKCSLKSTLKIKKECDNLCAFTKYKVLMIWSVELEMETDFIMKFWKKGKDKLAMALMAYKACKEQYEQHEGSKKGMIMQQQMRHFEDLAIKVLLEVSLLDERKRFWYLNTRIESLDVSPIEIALQANCERFLAEAPCKKLMDEIWTDPIEDVSRGWYSLFFISLICPLLSPFLVKFDEESELLEQFDMKYEDERTECGYNFSIEETFVRKFADKIHSYNNRHRAASIKYIWYVRSFLTAPVVRFIYTLLFHVLFLILFSIVMLTDYKKDFGGLEGVLYAWVLILGIEEVKQAHKEGKEYLNKWNVLDNIGMLLFLTGFLLRIVFNANKNSYPEFYYTSRIVFAFSLMVFILRTLQLLGIDAALGPKIHMIGRLLKDLIGFMLILALIIAAYGIVSNVILYPNQPLDAQLLKDVFSDAWWSLFSQFNQQDAAGSKCDSNETKVTASYCSSTTDTNINYTACKSHKCPANSWIVSVLLPCYGLISVIMMLNVLIAMFNDTFSKVEGKKMEIYNVKRFQLMCEHSNKSVIPAPLCVVTYWRFVPWCMSGAFKLCWRKCCKRGRKARDRKPWTLFRRNLPYWADNIEDNLPAMDDEGAHDDDLKESKLRLNNLKKSDFEIFKRFLSTLPLQISNEAGTSNA